MPHPDSLAGTTIYLHDFSRSLRKRMQDRKIVGPYQWTVSEPVTGRRKGGQDGRGFYFNQNGEMATVARLRVEEVSSIGRNRVTGYCGGGDSIITPYIFRLPHGRGFLAGCGEGAGMWGSISFTVHEDEDEAKQAAHAEAEAAAYRDREAEERYQAELDAAEEGDEEEEDEV